MAALVLISWCYQDRFQRCDSSQSLDIVAGAVKIQRETSFAHLTPSYVYPCGVVITSIQSKVEWKPLWMVTSRGTEGQMLQILKNVITNILSCVANAGTTQPEKIWCAWLEKPIHLSSIHLSMYLSIYRIQRFQKRIDSHIQGRKGGFFSDL